MVELISRASVVPFLEIIINSPGISPDRLSNSPMTSGSQGCRLEQGTISPPLDAAVWLALLGATRLTVR